MAAVESRFIPYRRTSENEAAIVLVHGFHGKAADTWKEFTPFIEKAPPLAGWDLFSVGYATNLRVDIPGIWSADPDILKISELLATRAAVDDLARYKSLALVAHSMGGLVVQRALLDDAKLRSRTSHVVLFGTPSAGLVKAQGGWFLKRQLRDMAHDGVFVRELRERWRQAFGADHASRHPFTFAAVAGERDEFVPASSSIGPFSPEAFPDVKRYVVPGNHLEIVSPGEHEDLSVDVLVKTLLGEAAAAGPWNSARVAVESRQFEQAIAQFWPARDQLDSDAVVQLALALESVGRKADALDVLKNAGRRDTDAMGVLAGRLKRRWLAERRAEDAESSHQFYASGYAQAVTNGDSAQAYYLGINVAFLELMWKSALEAARKTARAVLDHCQAAAATELPRDRKWRLATEGEAQLVLGDFDKALDGYRAALAAAPAPSPREIASMHSQATWLVARVGDETLAEQLTAIFRGDAS